ncbi:hypothetical protein RO3G_10504 [Rhizopus delemar RA 99-880]|uniref:Transposase n=1 Tax=Rhizopus delemar (strain RA 99-880 / ATCC MYA-4621 / FGSC 9543 / NRRL 43880) TaxID=246409 RepID=I1CBG4_RHIO9|nr:hypothetical protein RO3G_10504 [Rhizopus delemar RA 99-880]|eukprot:EIE85794.1 hypothetical protein RO3G_10504 [Rhizopus delemar RA 99-880]
MNLWTEIIDMNSAALKPQELNVLRFRETIQTDDVSVTVFKKRQDRKSRYIGLQSTFVEPEPYITDLNVQQRGDITDRCSYSAPNTRYQEPVRGVGLRRLLKEHGFLMHLIDEFRTSQCCPSCGHRSLTTFKRMPDPQPYQRRNNPEVICHGLLSSGAEELCERLWNRGLVTCLSMIHIVRNLRLNSEIPERFQRAGIERRGPTRRRRSEENEERRALFL